MLGYAPPAVDAAPPSAMWPETFAAILDRDKCLSGMTTVRVGGRAKWLAVPRTEAELGGLLAALHGSGVAHRVIGGGSNLLPPDEEIDAVVIHPVRLDGLRIEGDRILAGAGVGLPALIAQANEAALAGLHVLAGIPGQLGGALAMNAGGRYGEIADVVETVTVRLNDGSPAVLSKPELEYGYRHSHLPEGAVITGACLRLRQVEDRRELKRESGRILKEKNAAQPTTGWNFGCMFKNPPGQSAGKLLEAAGLKGLTRGGARISPRHANFAENMGTATAADIRWLLAEAERQVMDHLAIRLEREVRVWA